MIGSDPPEFIDRIDHRLHQILKSGGTIRAGGLDGTERTKGRCPLNELQAAAEAVDPQPGLGEVE
jgi:hypothetical protein